MKLADVEAILRALNDAEVRYLIVGGLAVVAHGYVRYTADIDVVLDLERANALRAMKALDAIGYKPLIPVRAVEFADEEKRRFWITEKNMLVFQMHNPDDPRRTTPYLLGASIAVPITEKAANLLARPTTFFSSTEVVNFEQPGLEVTRRGGLVVYPDKEDIGKFGSCRLREGDFVLRDDAGNAYDGELPYLVISLDGRANSELSKWKSTALSAAMTSRSLW